MEWGCIHLKTSEHKKRATKCMWPVCVSCTYANYSSRRLEIIFIGVFEIRKIMCLIYQFHNLMLPPTVIIVNNGRQAHVLKELTLNLVILSRRSEEIRHLQVPNITDQ